jgi:hypothetical protein
MMGEDSDEEEEDESDDGLPEEDSVLKIDADDASSDDDDDDEDDDDQNDELNAVGSDEDEEAAEERITTAWGKVSVALSFVTRAATLVHARRPLALFLFRSLQKSGRWQFVQPRALAQPLISASTRLHGHAPPPPHTSLLAPLSNTLSNSFPASTYTSVPRYVGRRVNALAGDEYFFDSRSDFLNDEHIVHSDGQWLLVRHPPLTPERQSCTPVLLERSECLGRR